MHPTFAFDQFSTALSSDSRATQVLDEISHMTLGEVRTVMGVLPDETAVHFRNLAQFYRLWRLHEEANRAPD